jgi:beta-galactosidase/beta-glucuronidase
MAPTFYLLRHSDVKPGNTVTLEIVLSSLKDIPVTDASYIPKADHWRSNISSCLWDDVLLRTHNDLFIDRVIPFTDFSTKKLTVKAYIKTIQVDAQKPDYIQATILSDKNKILVSERIEKLSNGIATIKLNLDNKIETWSIDNPEVYQLQIQIIRNKAIIDETIQNYGFREFKTDSTGYRFLLNNQPLTARAASVVWHRWVRDQEGYEIAWDTAWFRKNIVQRLKKHGANTLRFHLGNPPERFLDMCDRNGILVQYEWSFFHGMPATYSSLVEQWQK